MRMINIEESAISAAIVESFSRDFMETLSLDVAVAGAGPSGITAARYLAAEGYKVAVFERNLYVGGGMWGGGMLFPRIVVQEEARHVFEEVGVGLRPAVSGMYVVDAVEAVARCTSAAIGTGATIWVGMGVEDVVMRKERVCGVVLNWMAVERAGLHVDPLAVMARMVIDATGHDAEICRTVKSKVPGLNFPTTDGTVVGERPMWAERGEAALARNTCEVYPGLIVAGMTANAVFGSYRMGAIFGGMLLSGKRAAELASELLGPPS